jgi:hypothetical protein
MVNDKIKELTTIIMGTLILTIAITFGKENNTLNNYLITFASLIIIISVSIIIKKLVAYHYESDIKTKFWEIYQYGLRKDAHLIKPAPMAWVPIVLSLISRGMFWWLGIFEFEIKPLPERVSKRHDLYRFSEMAEIHIAIISVSGVIACLILAILGYFSNFEYFAKLATYYAFWSIIPLSSLDGSKILFGNKAMWITTTFITSIFLLVAMSI